MFTKDYQLTKQEIRGLYYVLPSDPDNRGSEFGAMLFLSLFRLRNKLEKKLNMKPNKATISFEYESIIGLCHLAQVIDSTNLEIEFDSIQLYGRAIISSIQLKMPLELIKLMGAKQYLKIT